MKARMPGPFTVGLAEVKITPPLGTPMAGFAARQDTAKGVHDDLHVRTLVVSNGENAVALVSAEVIGVEKEVVLEIRELAGARTGIPAGNILISGTHTHSGPVLGGDYRNSFVQSTVSSIVKAWRSRRPRSIGTGTVTHLGWVGMNRRQLESGFNPVDKEIAILKVVGAENRTKAVLFNYSCHPACLGPDNLQISADWPHFVSKRIKNKLGKSTMVLFFQGTEGNVNTGYSSGLSAIGAPIPTRTFAYASELGDIIADAVLARLPKIPVERDRRLGARQETVPLEYYIPSTSAEADATLQQAARQVQELQASCAPLTHIRAAEVARAFAEYSLHRLESNLAAGQAEFAAEIQAFRIGGAGFVSFPGEFFVEAGLGVKKRSPFRTTFCLGLANDSLGYVPVEAAYPEGGYEISVARFKPGSAERWVDVAARLLRTLARRR